MRVISDNLAWIGRIEALAIIFVFRERNGVAHFVQHIEEMRVDIIKDRRLVAEEILLAFQMVGDELLCPIFDFREVNHRKENLRNVFRNQAGEDALVCLDEDSHSNLQSSLLFHYFSMSCWIFST